MRLRDIIENQIKLSEHQPVRKKPRHMGRLCPLLSQYEQKPPNTHPLCRDIATLNTDDVREPFFSQPFPKTAHIANASMSESLVLNRGCTILCTKPKKKPCARGTTK